ncbi:hypothetical protein D9M68_688960 [compost metagenome]
MADHYGGALQRVQRVGHVLAQVGDGRGREGRVLQQRAVAAHVQGRAGQAGGGEISQVMRVAPGAVVGARHEQQARPTVARRRADQQAAAAGGAGGQLVGQAEVQRIRAGVGEDGREGCIHLAAILRAGL